VCVQLTLSSQGVPLFCGAATQVPVALQLSVVQNSPSSQALQAMPPLPHLVVDWVLPGGRQVFPSQQPLHAFPGTQAQFPATQVRPFVQAAPALPQTQVELLHRLVVSAGHGLKQPPQWSTSSEVLTHLPLQSV
jgi:hypothetical protein